MTSLRSFLRSWLGIDDDATKADAVMTQHARSLGQIRREMGEVRLIARQLDPMNRPPWFPKDDAPYTAEQRKAAVDGLIGDGEG